MSLSSFLRERNLKSIISSPYIIVVLLILSIASVAAFLNATSNNATISVSLSSPNIKQYDVEEFTFTVSKTYTNPFDPDIINGKAIITDPDGVVISPAAFWYESVNYLNSGNDDYKVVPNSGVFKVRFAPKKVGTYQYTISVTDSSGTTTSTPGSFTVTASSNHGFVVQDTAHPTRFAFEDGNVFLPRGSNMDWNQQIQEYASHFAAFKDSKMNFARIWMPFPSAHFLLEWNGTKQISNVDTIAYQGLGRYNQENAYKLDWLFSQAKANDVYLMLTLFTYHNFWNWVGENPYGPIVGADAHAFWTNVEARRNFRNYVRYVTARYGAYTNLAIIEFWNELDHSSVNPLALPDGKNVMKNWHQEMVDVLNASAPRKILASTSFAAFAKPWNDGDGTKSFNSLPMLQVAQAHHYDHSANATNMVWGWGDMARWANGKFNRPFLIGEYGYNGEESYPGTIGPKLNRLNHHSTWAPIMLGGAAGSNLLWRVNWYFFPPQDFRDNAKRFGTWIESEVPLLRNMDFMYGGETADPFWVGGYKKANRAALYFLNKAAHWDYEDSSITNVSNATYTISPFENGTYTVQITDPITGTLLSSTSKTISSGQITLSLPTFKRDLAIKIFNPLEIPPTRFTPTPSTSTTAPSVTQSIPTNTPTQTIIYPTATPTPKLADTTPPLITFVTVQNGMVLPQKSGINVSAKATDASGISLMKIYIDNVLVRTCGYTPCAYYWQLTPLTKGNHVIKVTATDKSSLNTSTASVTVTKQ